MTRPHPFDFVFAELAETRFGDIGNEAGPRDIGFAAFSRLPSVQRLLQEIGTPDLLEATPEAVVQYLALLFVAFRYWESGKQTFPISRERLEASFGRRPGEPSPVPGGACYLEFPEHWFWAAVDDDSPHEPVEGVFVASSDGGKELTVVAVLGLRAQRQGFSQITVSGTASDVLQAGEVMRQPPFAPVLGGGAQAGVKSVTSQGELLHLAHLALATLSQ